MKKIILLFIFCTGLLPGIRQGKLIVSVTDGFSQTELDGVEICATNTPPQYLYSESNGDEVYEDCSQIVDCENGDLIQEDCTQFTVSCEFNCSNGDDGGSGDTGGSNTGGGTGGGGTGGGGTYPTSVTSPDGSLSIKTFFSALGLAADSHNAAISLAATLDQGAATVLKSIGRGGTIFGAVAGGAPAVLNILNGNASTRDWINAGVAVGALAITFSGAGEAVIGLEIVYNGVTLSWDVYQTLNP